MMGMTEMVKSASSHQVDWDSKTYRTGYVVHIKELYALDEAAAKDKRLPLSFPESIQGEKRKAPWEWVGVALVRGAWSRKPWYDFFIPWTPSYDMEYGPIETIRFVAQKKSAMGESLFVASLDNTNNSAYNGPIQQVANELESLLHKDNTADLFNFLVENSHSVELVGK
jgi:hypothetical protein